jgi:simple sugar transport system substrate-binding protein
MGNMPTFLKYILITLVIFVALAILPLLGCEAVEEKTDTKIGMILVGPRNDKGWSQAHYEGGEHVISKLGGEMITVDLVNPADSPDLTIPSIAEDMISQGASVIFATSDDMKDGILEAAKLYPDTNFVWSSGDSALKEGNAYKPELKNLANIMGKMEYGQMIAGCAAAIKSEDGKIGFLGPLINDETRRLANATYLGALYCAEDKDIDFDATWIGFWFHIPGVTLDPTQVVNEFYDADRDVVISHIDTTEAVVVAGQRAANGENVWVVPYDYEGACQQAPNICLGVNYFNWGFEYLSIVEKSNNDKFINEWIWAEPNWKNMDESMIGFKYGDGLTSAEKTKLGKFIDELEDGLNLFKGPLYFEDGSVYLEEGQSASDLDIWYTPQVLKGIK